MPEPELRVGATVRCRRTGIVGKVQAIQEVRIDGHQLPDMVFVSTNASAGTGIVRDAPSLEVMGASDG